ncbi:MgtC/SapB family protein [Patescibacteria group bacterium]|nr:MgtC/SapB family protein [Patescibacteria group bacterium]MBU1613247.1 MgtC/SapB family protein [Patescibacteria group bacterium]
MLYTILHFPEIRFAGQMILAILLGGLIGWQRERWHRAAGLRTFALVTAGATLFTILSRNAFGENESSRVAAAVVTGIGFLGAGTILHKKDRVEGLTTAAGLWITAAVGMVIGVGYYLLAAIATLIIFIALMIDPRKKLLKRKKKKKWWRL